MFDGKTFSGWEGDPKYWSVIDGAMVGQITPETVIKSNTFIIWQGGTPADFELKVDIASPREATAGSTTVAWLFPILLHRPTGLPCEGINATSMARIATRVTTTKRREGCSSVCEDRSVE